MPDEVKKSIEDLKKLPLDELAKHAQEGWDLAASLREDVTDLKARIHRLEGPFTCHHAPDYVGGACAACHVNLIDALESVGRQVQGGTIKDIVDNALKSVTWKKGAENGPRKE